MTLFSTECRCGSQRVPVGVTVVLDTLGNHHRVYVACDSQRIDVATDPTPAPRPWRLVDHTCEHGATFWATGPDPEALLAEWACDCEEAA